MRVRESYTLLRVLIFSWIYILLSGQQTVYAETQLPDSLQQKLTRATSSRARISAHLAIADYFIRSSFKDALVHGQQALFLAEQEGDHSLMMKASKSIASVFYYMSVPDQSLKYMERASMEAEKAGDIFEALNNQLNISLLYTSLGQFAKAASLLEEGKRKLTRAYAEARKPFPVSDQITFFLNLGYCYASVLDFNTAIPKLDSGITLARQDSNHNILLIRLLIAKADAMLKSGNQAACKQYLDESDVLLLANTDISLHATQQLVYARLYTEQKDWASALKSYKNALNEANYIGNKGVKGGCIEGLYQTYKQLGNKDSALAYLTLKETFLQESTNEKAQEELIRKELLTEFKNREEKLIKKNKQASTRLWTITISTAIALLIMVFILIRLRNRYSASNLKKLQLQLETERLQLQQEQLQARLNQQEKQIGEYAYKLSKNALLQELVQDLQASKRQDTTVIEQSEETETQPPAVWEQFETRFLQTHQGFYEHLMKECPSLTPNERRLSAFLLLDMSTREISVITGQSIRAIEIARIRLRKKLNLTQSNTSLFEFLSTI